MKLEIFSVFDSAAKAFMAPFLAETIEVAIRRFRATVNHEGSDFGRFPEDYTLFHVGTFHQEDGSLLALSTPHSLGVALTFVQCQTNGRPEVVHAS